MHVLSSVIQRDGDGGRARAGRLASPQTLHRITCALSCVTAWHMSTCVVQVTPLDARVRELEVQLGEARTECSELAAQVRLLVVISRCLLHLHRLVFEFDHSGTY